MKLLGHLLKDVVVPRPDSGKVYSVKSQPLTNRSVKCLGCRRELVARVSRERRLRTLRSNCCNRRMRPLNWTGWKDGRATLEWQIAKRRAVHAAAQRKCGIVRCPNPHGDGRCGCSDPDGICEADHLDISDG